MSQQLTDSQKNSIRFMQESGVYARSFRREDKRAYAHNYRHWLNSDQSSIAPDRPNSLSYMAAQAIRLQLQAMFDKA